MIDQLGDIAGDGVFAWAVVGVNVCHATITDIEDAQHSKFEDIKDKNR